MTAAYRKLVAALQAAFPYQPTADQTELFATFAHFFTHADPYKMFMLKGYAGTGKTSFVRAVVKAIPHTQHYSVLLAPTGRSAKVLSQYAGQSASTIHKKIYYTSNEGGGNWRLKRRENKHRRCLFIVDEASMIGDGYGSGGRYNSLLEDLIEYVYSSKDCSLMLIGDPAQLPPVGMEDSPALSQQHIAHYGNFKLFQHQLQLVMRQHSQSGILQCANALRIKLHDNDFGLPLFSIAAFDEVVRLEGADLQDYLQEAIGQWGLENCLVITRSNKRAVLYNQAMRQRILYKENKIESGELLMVVKNNYHYLSDENSFLANGELIELLQIVTYYDFYGFYFAEVEVQLVDKPEHASFTAILLLNTLDSDTPALSQDDYQRLFSEIEKDYADIANKGERMQAIKADKFYNAIQVKYAYALTCHKTQGGQWDAVFIDYPWLPPDSSIDADYIKWLYTACTRAVKRLYLVNFEETFFDAE